MVLQVVAGNELKALGRYAVLFYAEEFHAK